MDLLIDVFGILDKLIQLNYSFLRYHSKCENGKGHILTLEKALIRNTL